jgi:hypothetical protein
MGERRGVYRVMVWKLDVKGQLRSTRYRWKDNIKIDLEQEGWHIETGGVF